MPLKLYFMKCSERKISQCILALINPFKYLNYSTQRRAFYRSTYIERLYENITLSYSFLHHHLQTKKYFILNNFFFTCKQFLIPLSEAGMKVSIPDLLEQLYEIVEYAKKTLSLSLARVLYLVT